MNRLDAGRNRQGPSNRPNNKRKRGQNGPENGPNRGVTGVRVIKAGPPPIDYTQRYKPEYGCPLTSYVKGTGTNFISVLLLQKLTFYNNLWFEYI